MAVKIAEGAHGAQAKENDDRQSDQDQADDKFPLFGIRGVIHGSPPQGFGAASNSNAMIT